MNPDLKTVCVPSVSFSTFEQKFRLDKERHPDAAALEFVMHCLYFPLKPRDTDELAKNRDGMIDTLRTVFLVPDADFADIGKRVKFYGSGTEVP